MFALLGGNYGSVTTRYVASGFSRTSPSCLAFPGSQPDFVGRPDYSGLLVLADAAAASYFDGHFADDAVLFDLEAGRRQSVPPARLQPRP